MVGAAGAQSPAAGERRALDVLEQRRAGLGLTRADIGEVEVTGRVFDEDTRTTHLHLRQLVDGVPVPSGVMNISIDGRGRLLTLGDRFVENVARRTGPGEAQLTPAQGVQAAAGLVGLPAHRRLEQVDPPSGPARETAFEPGWPSADPVEVALAWVPDGRDLRLAWETTLEGPNGHWHVAIDARTGEPLARRRIDADATDGARYTAFAPPLAHPGERTELVDPADPVASPHGWHDTDGLEGADTTRTEGINARVVFMDSTAPDGGEELRFTPVLDLAADPSAYADARAVNAFVWVNHLHDVLFRHGFDEDAANFQRVNRSGVRGGGDAVRVLVRPDSGIANMGTEADGSISTMNLGTQRRAPRAHIELPAPVGVRLGTVYRVGPNASVSGPPLVLGADCKLGEDAKDAVLILRRECQTPELMTSLGDSGAKAAVLAPIRIFPSTAKIPVLGIEPPEDAFLLDRLDKVTTLSVVTSAALPHDREYALANDVIVHEYGHGVSARLVGGGSNVLCQGSNEPMGEGWSDFIGLVLTARGGGDADRFRVYGTWPNGEDAEGPGARRLPYSPDSTKSPLTYADLPFASAIPWSGKIYPQEHFVGMRWAAALWQVYWELVDRHGYSADHRGHWTKGGNLRALRLVLDGMKLTPCQPGFVDARNAVLRADQNLTGGQDQCPIWRGFAARGLGRDADQGTTTWGDREAWRDQTPDGKVPAVSCREPVPDTAVARRGRVAVPAPGVRANDPPESADDRLELVDPPQHGTVELADDGSFVYIDEDSYEGEDTFSYRLSDGLAVSPKAYVTIDATEPKTPTTTTLTASPSPSVLGQEVRFTAKVAGGAGGAVPAGEVSIERNGTEICRSAEVQLAVCDVTFTTPTDGTPEKIVARYSGDADFARSTSATHEHTVNRIPTTTTLAMQPEHPVTGEQVTYVAKVERVDGEPAVLTGDVTFRNGVAAVCEEVALSGGLATCRTTYRATSIPVFVTAGFSGDATYAASTSGVLQHVVAKAQTETTLTRSSEVPVSGQPVTYEATVSVVAPGEAAVSGFVGFRNGDVPIEGCDAVAVSDGQAECTTTHLASGPAPAIAAEFHGSPDLLDSSSDMMTLRVAKAASGVTLTQAPDPTAWGDRLTVTATAAAVAPGGGTPAGSVTFSRSDGVTEAPVGDPVPLVGGVASMTMPLLAPDTRIVARYSGGPEHEHTSTTLTPRFAFDRVVAGGSHLALTITSGRWLVKGASVGVLTVLNGASVAVMDSRLGAISFIRGTSFALCNSQVTGAVSVVAAQGPLLIGSPSSVGCAPNRMLAWLSLGLPSVIG